MRISTFPGELNRTPIFSANIYNALKFYDFLFFFSTFFTITRWKFILNFQNNLSAIFASILHFLPIFGYETIFATFCNKVQIWQKLLNFTKKCQILAENHQILTKIIKFWQKLSKLSEKYQILFKNAKIRELIFRVFQKIENVREKQFLKILMK